ncbi:MAG: hypothetical protein WBG08_14090 [Litorimonas sp.]
MTLSPKKSEMLEVRLSLEDKVSLRRRAAQDGLTVSAAVRGLVAEYLRETRPVAHTHPIRSLAMTLISHPRKALIGGAAVVSSAVAVSPLAHADPARIALVFEQTRPVSETVDGAETAGVRVRRTDAELEVDGEAQVCLALAPDTPCDMDDPDSVPGTALYFTVTDVGAATYVVRMEIREDGALVSTPWLTLSGAQSASFEAESDDGTKIAVSLSPTDA